ncbi:MAG: imidazoleglycerol-phosphate dehydratase HisB [Candidatus Odinarchaeota archaeon]
MRTSDLNRKTKETEISIKINLDGKGASNIRTPIKFLNHMLSTLSKHSSIDMSIVAGGDSPHHITEDVAITLAEAINTALGDKKGIERFGEAIIPMDDTLAQVAVDIGGRPYYVFNIDFKRPTIDDMAAEDIIHFLKTFTSNLKINLHGKILYGENDHHKVEALFKALAVALKRAIKLADTDTIPSTKGVI